MCLVPHGAHGPLDLEETLSCPRTPALTTTRPLGQTAWVSHVRPELQTFGLWGEDVIAKVKVQLASGNGSQEGGCGWGYRTGSRG